MQKPKPKIAIFALGPPRFGGLEVLFPIIAELKDHEIYSDAWLFSYSGAPAQKQLDKDDFLSQIRQELFTRYIIGSSFLCHIYLLAFLFKNIALNHQTLCLLPKGHTSLLIKIGTRLRLITALSYPKVTSLRKTKETNDKQQEKQIALEFNRGPCAIGIPKFYKSWNRRIEKYYKKEDFDAKTIVIFLPSVVDHIFSYQELELWVEEVLAALAPYCNSYSIIIKPHPMLKIQPLELIFKQFEKDLTIEIKPGNPLAALQKATLAISHHSSVILDSLFADVPTVFYQKFTDHWLQTHPEKSYLLDLGAVHFEEKQELMKFIEKKDFEHIRNKRNFLAKIGHKDNLLPVLTDLGIL